MFHYPGCSACKVRGMLRSMEPLRRESTVSADYSVSTIERRSSTFTSRYKQYHTLALSVYAAMSVYKEIIDVYYTKLVSNSQHRPMSYWVLTEDENDTARTPLLDSDITSNAAKIKQKISLLEHETTEREKRIKEWHKLLSTTFQSKLTASDDECSGSSGSSQSPPPSYDIEAGLVKVHDYPSKCQDRSKCFSPGRFCVAFLVTILLVSILLGGVTVVLYYFGGLDKLISPTSNFIGNANLPETTPTTIVRSTATFSNSRAASTSPETIKPKVADITTTPMRPPPTTTSTISKSREITTKSQANQNRINPLRTSTGIANGNIIKQTNDTTQALTTIKYHIPSSINSSHTDNDNHEERQLQSTRATQNITLPPTQSTLSTALNKDKPTAHPTIQPVFVNKTDDQVVSQPNLNLTAANFEGRQLLMPDGSTPSNINPVTDADDTNETEEVNYPSTTTATLPTFKDLNMPVSSSTAFPLLTDSTKASQGNPSAEDNSKSLLLNENKTSHTNTTEKTLSTSSSGSGKYLGLQMVTLPSETDPHTKLDESIDIIDTLALSSDDTTISLESGTKHLDSRDQPSSFSNEINTKPSTFTLPASTTASPIIVHT